MSIESHPITDRASWLDLRRQDVTASDVAALCGCSPFKTPLQVWAEKTGTATDQSDTPLMRRGRHMEAGIIAACREAAEWHDRYIIQPNVYLRDVETRLGATPDAFILDGSHNRVAVLQCKLVARPVFDSEWTSGVPLHYQLQVLTEMMLSEVQQGWLACYVIDAYHGELRPFRIDRHPSAELRILGAVAKFWADVDAGRRPSADYARDGALLTTLKPPEERLPPLDWSRDNFAIDLLSELEILRAEISEREKRCEAIRAELLAKMDGAPKARAPGWSLSYKTVHVKEHMVPARNSPRLTITRVKTQEQTP